MFKSPEVIVSLGDAVFSLDLLAYAFHGCFLLCNPEKLGGFQYHISWIS
jgi:hypothetical protein